jgi:hypothetical protein
MANIVVSKFVIDPSELRSGLASDLHLVEPRSPGVHQSDIIRDLENTIIKPGQRPPDYLISPEELAQLGVYRELGFMWEVVLEAVFKRRRVDNLDGRKFLRQMEFQFEGVYRTLDAIHIPDWRVLEYKLTFRSANRASLDKIETEFWSWFVQLKGNCYSQGTRIASLFVLFVNGTYNPPVPDPLRYDIQFTDEELEDNHRMLMTHLGVMKEAGRI